jgi:type II secretory pathway component GspD/PulD (secretin)
MVNDFIVENDRKQPQAYLEISIVSLTEEGSRTFNNTWLLENKNISVAYSGTTTTAGPYSWHGPSSGYGNSSSVSLQHAINYIIDNKKGRMLANPKIVITNGKKAVIDLTQDYIETTTVQILSNVSVGTASNTSVQ